MTTRVITCANMPARRIGSMAVGERSPNKPLSEVTVEPGGTFAGIRTLAIRCEGESSKTIRLYLTEAAAMELVKGILEGVAYISIESDTELLAIMKKANELAERDAQGIKQVLDDLHNPRHRKPK